MTKLTGRTYTLPENGEYYAYIAQQVDTLLAKIGDLPLLDKILSELVAKDAPFKRKYHAFESIFALMSYHMGAFYTPQLPDFLAASPIEHTDDTIFALSPRGYHLRMLHIEVLNRLMRKDFLNATHKVVLLPHCLRDFRADKCQFQPGDVDYICLGCNKECRINQTKNLLKDYPDYHIYISQNMDLDEVFDLAHQRYKNIGLLGVACIPELYEGMILSRKKGFPAQGVLLNYNRCQRWMGKAHYTNFNLEQFKRIIAPLNKL